MGGHETFQHSGNLKLLWCAKCKKTLQRVVTSEASVEALFWYFGAPIRGPQRVVFSTLVTLLEVFGPGAMN